MLRPAAVPAAILAAAAILAGAVPRLPPAYAELRDYGPYAILVPAAAVTLWFNRGRAFVAAASLLAAYAGWGYALSLGPVNPQAKAVTLALALLVPLNVLIALLLPERGVVHHGAWRWLVLVAAEALAVAWIPAAGRAAGDAWQGLLGSWLLRAPEPPLAARLLFAAAFASATWRAWPKLAEQGRAPLEVGIAGALVCFLVAAAFPGSAGATAVFMAAAGAMPLVAVLEESHHMAFRDALTGLPSRRALEERLRGLGPRYAIAMVDVDHFKAFNDSHGHDVGDQVLKLVAARLAEMEGGGTAYRYGGEEFMVLFADARLAEALPQLERLRAEIERYKMAVRAGDRPKSEKTGSRQRGAGQAGQAEQTLSVTVSIGAAEPGGKRKTPAEVIKAADEALYRAKDGGRNRVSR